MEHDEKKRFIEKAIESIPWGGFEIGISHEM